MAERYDCATDRRVQVDQEWVSLVEKNAMWHATMREIMGVLVAPGAAIHIPFEDLKSIKKLLEVK